MYNPFSLEGKTILVTGASSGIGRATAVECSKMGATVVITGRNVDRLNDTFVALQGDGHIQIVADLNDENSLTELVERCPILNGIVNVAGVCKTLPFPFVNRKDLMSIFDTNFFAPTIVTQQLIKKKKLGKNSSIVFISSIDGPVTAHIGNSMYAASKGAVSAMVKNMAVDLAAKNIRVNSVCPGMTETPLIYNDSITQEQLDLDKSAYPLKRYGDPKDIALAVIYFLSDASSWTTGSQLIVDGGFTLQ